MDDDDDEPASLARRACLIRLAAGLFAFISLNCRPSKINAYMQWEIGRHRDIDRDIDGMCKCASEEWKKKEALNNNKKSTQLTSVKWKKEEEQAVDQLNLFETRC